MLHRFEYGNLRLRVAATDCRDAIQKAGDILIENGDITQHYITEINEAFDQLGPYFVLSPGLAFAHSRPSESVIRTALSIITLEDPVDFGNAANDPVFMVCMIASRDAAEHIELLKNVATFLGDGGNVIRLRRAKTEEDARAIVDALNERSV